MTAFENIEQICYGAAAVIDTAVLLALAERRNLERLALPILLLVVGAWLFHAGSFTRALLAGVGGPWAGRVEGTAMLAMVAGLMLMPCAMLHTVSRLWWTGLAGGGRPRPLHLAGYLPMLALWPAARLIAPDPRGVFLEVLGPLILPYVVWLLLVNVVAAATALGLSARAGAAWERGLYRGLAIGLVTISAAHAIVLFVAIPLAPSWRGPLQLIVALSPLLLLLLFVYYVYRFNFMRLVFERTVAYGVIVVGAVLVYRTAFRDLRAELQERLHVDLVLVEGLAVTGLVLAYQPLRQRTSEALRYLMGERVSELRERTRKLAIELSTLAGEPPRDVLAWFCDALRRTLETGWVAAWTFDETGAVAEQAVSGPLPAGADVVGDLRGELLGNDDVAWTRDEAPSREAERLMEEAGADAALALEHPGVSGLLLMGRRRRGLTHEQLNALAILAEQLAITLNYGLVQADRLAAERRALQNEKLSTLGLVASSIAHEVKNPLSSIKTIVTVLEEDLGPDAPAAPDLAVVRREIDRLSQTVTRLLSFARPSATSVATSSPLEVLDETIEVMRHAAERRGVTLRCDSAPGVPARPMDASALREIFFNLLTNAIEAAGEGGLVDVSGRLENDTLVITVHDSGPGVPPEIQDRLFEPFVTGKDEGTGLGLYVAGRRVRDLGGEITCEVAKGDGTAFTLRLPYGES